MLQKKIEGDNNQYTTVNPNLGKNFHGKYGLNRYWSPKGLNKKSES